MNIIVPPFASAQEIDEIVSRLVAELADDGERATPEALAELKWFITEMSSSYLVGGVRISRMPDGSIESVSEH